MIMLSYVSYNDLLKIIIIINIIWQNQINLPIGTTPFLLSLFTQWANCPLQMTIEINWTQASNKKAKSNISRDFRQTSDSIRTPELKRKRYLMLRSDVEKGTHISERAIWANSGVLLQILSPLRVEWFPDSALCRGTNSQVRWRPTSY